MNKFVGSALAIAMTGSLGFASNDTDSEWLGLDQEINSLSSTMSTQGGGVDVGALIRSSLIWSEEDNLLGSEDFLGWNFNDIDFWMEGSVGDYDWRVQVDFDGLADQNSVAGSSGDGVRLEDVWVDIPAHESIHLRWGNIKVPTLRSNSIYPEYLLFKNRTVIGSTFDFWDLGLMVWGEIEQFNWYVAIQNGLDSRQDDIAYTIRLEIELGEGAADMEGSYGTSQDLAGMVGVFYRDDTDNDFGGNDRRIIGLDAAATFEMFSVYGEIIDVDDDISGSVQNDFRAVNGLFIDGDSTPWSLTASFLFVPDEWEAAIRYEDLDNQFDTWLLSIGLNWYRSGHNAKWQLAWIQADSDDGGPDGSAIVLSLAVGHSTSS